MNNLSEGHKKISQTLTVIHAVHFYFRIRLGDCERSLGLPVTPFCDRTQSTIATIQAGNCQAKSS